MLRHLLSKICLKLSKKYKPQTVRHILALFKRIVNFGHNRNLSSSLKFKIDMPKGSSLKTEDLNPEQINSLIEVIQGDPHIYAGKMMLTALYTGMRRGENASRFSTPSSCSTFSRVPSVAWSGCYLPGQRRDSFSTPRSSGSSST